MVRINSLTKQYGGRVLFSGLDWQIRPEARVGLVGPNGAGKTTLLRILAGEEHPESGEILRPKAQSIGYLAQEIVASPDGSILAETLEAEHEIRTLEEEIESVESALQKPGDPEASERLLARYGDLRHRYEARGGYELEARARAILSGLGFREAQLHEPVRALSGGFRMRVALARLLLARPGLLLLDEPTNHLDLETLDWLEEFMADYEGAIIVASHDRVFLNRMTDEIGELDAGRFTLYPGNYDAFLEIRELRREQQEAAAAQQARRVAEIERFIERFRAKATKARQAQSRVKLLAKMKRIEAPARRSRTMRLAFPAPPRGGAVPISLRGVVKRYGAKTVYDGLDFTTARGDRIALVGPNGAGKTTLLRLLAGVLPFEGGERLLGHGITLAYYAQHQLENLDPERTILESAAEGAPDEIRPRLRTLLGAFLFHGDDVDKKIAVLSGGERARVALCRMLLRPANLLLLDEPTNHLDLQSREVLEGALAEYAGTLIFISHDRYFINRLATKICAVSAGSLEVHLGDYDDWQEQVSRRASGPAGGGPARPAAGRLRAEPVAPAGAAVAGKEAAREERRRADTERRAQREEAKRREAALRPQRTRLRLLEEEIAAEESRLEEIATSQTDPAVYSDPERARSAAHERRGAEERIATLYDEWQRLADQVDA